jgi:hypothetical protein
MENESVMILKDADSDLLNGFKKRYDGIHPLIFLRSLERSKSPGDLFDILETVPNDFPIVWNEGKCRWVHVSDFMQSIFPKDWLD